MEVSPSSSVWTFGCFTWFFLCWGTNGTFGVPWQFFHYVEQDAVWWFGGSIWHYEEVSHLWGFQARTYFPHCPDLSAYADWESRFINTKNQKAASLWPYVIYSAQSFSGCTSFLLSFLARLLCRHEGEHILVWVGRIMFFLLLLMNKMKDLQVWNIHVNHCFPQ